MLPTSKNSILYNQFHLTHQSAFAPFVLTDIFSEYAGDCQTNCFHFWSMKNQVILGMKDTRVPHFKKGITYILENGYYPVVRNSGGLAVVSDEGVLNFSIILPKPSEQAVFSIEDGYHLMKHIIEKAFVDFNVQIDAFEIKDSYCPGHFDLSINKKKFAGISQRRLNKGIAILIYLSVSGNQLLRGQLIRDFYQIGLTNAFGTDGYPPVNPNSMATLSDLLQTPLTINDVHSRLKNVLTTEFTFNALIQKEFNHFLASKEMTKQLELKKKKMEQRNELINWSEIN